MGEETFAQRAQREIDALGPDYTPEQLLALAKKLVPAKRRGRKPGPKGDGMFRDEADFHRCLDRGLDRIQARLEQLTQEGLAKEMGARDAKQLRRWLEQYGLKWRDIAYNQDW